MECFTADFLQPYSINFLTSQNRLGNLWGNSYIHLFADNNSLSFAVNKNCAEM